MQKKLGLLILTLASLAITSCGCSKKPNSSQNASNDVSDSASESSSSTHTHTYSNEWSKDGTHHWHAATCEHKDEKKDYEEHTFGEWKTSKEAEEGVPGLKYKECSKCGYKVEEVIDALGHNYGNPQYTWNEDFSKCAAVRVCSYNNEHVETETVDSVYTKQNPTCKAEGSETYTASFGNPAFETQEHVNILPIDPDAHDFMVFTISADKYTEGGTLHTCILCGYNYTTDITSTEACFTYLYDDSLPGYEITGYTGEAEIINVPATHEGQPVVSVSSLTTGRIINIPDSVTQLGYDCFKDNTTLEQVNIPSSVTRLDGRVFYNCSSLKSIVVPDSVEFIDTYTFYGCTSLEEMTLPFIGKSNTYTHRYLCTIFGVSSSYEGNATYVPASLKKVTIGKACTLLEGYAFYKCQTLEEVVIGENVTSIGNSCFGGTKAIKVINIPKNVQSISSTAFYAYNSPLPLEEINVDPENAYYSSEDGVLYNKDKTTLVRYPCSKEDKLVAIPDTVTEIGENAFQYCQNIESITMNDNVTTLGMLAFYALINLKSITLSNSIKVLPMRCLCACKKLSSLTLPTQLEEIGNWALDQCDALKTIIMPATVNKIGEGAFYNTLTSLVFEGSVKSIQFEDNWNKYINNYRIISVANNAKPYGIMVNNETYNGAALEGFAQWDQKSLQFRVYVEGLQVGDTFTFYDDVAEEAFNMNIDPYSCGGSSDTSEDWKGYLDFDGTKYTVKVSGTYDFFIKINGTNNNVYFTVY